MNVRDRRHKSLSQGCCWDCGDLLSIGRCGAQGRGGLAGYSSSPPSPAQTPNPRGSEMRSELVRSLSEQPQRGQGKAGLNSGPEGNFHLCLHGTQMSPRSPWPLHTVSETRWGPMGDHKGRSAGICPNPQRREVLVGGRDRGHRRGRRGRRGTEKGQRVEGKTDMVRGPQGGPGGTRTRLAVEEALPRITKPGDEAGGPPPLT